MKQKQQGQDAPATHGRDAHATRKNRSIAALIILGVLAMASLPARAERVKDIVDIQGIRGNQLNGIGLVVGLNGTGDNSDTSRRWLANYLKKNGSTFQPDQVASKNIASVIVTAELGPFSRKGSRISITISATGNTTSLQGGTLLLTELKGADGQTYAVAQGQVTIGGFAASGENASVSKNHPTVGIIRDGATVEREELATFVEKGMITLNLRNADFTTAERMSKEINNVYPNSTVVEDGGTVKIEVPKKFAKSDIAKFIDTIGALDVKVDYPAVVVINERTGAIVVGENVKISSVAIALGSLTIVKSEKEYVSQPNEFADGKTEKVNRTEMNVNEGDGSLKYIPRQVSVAELAKALNSMGLSARDLITIFEMLHEAGALQAQIKTM